MHYTHTHTQHAYIHTHTHIYKLSCSNSYAANIYACIFWSLEIILKLWQRNFDMPCHAMQ